MIYFIFSFNQIGGVPILFYTISKGLISKNVKFGLIAKPVSNIKTLFDSLGYKFQFIDYDNLENMNESEIITSSDVVVTSWWDPKLIYFKNNKLLFWNVFPNDLKNSNLIFGDFYLKTRTRWLIEKMIKKNGLIFMDSSQFIWFNTIGMKETPSLILNIPIELRGNAYEYNNNKPTLRITYIGRAEVWKVFPLKKIIDDVSSIKNLEKPVEIIIITDNSMLFRTILENTGCNLNFITINYLENIKHDELSEFLINNSDINIGMGTALLESAKLGIPSIIIDPSFENICDNYRYKWLFDSKNGNLGIFYSKTLTYNGELLGDILLNYSDQDFIREKSRKCHEYVANFHNLQGIIESFISFCNSTQLKFMDLKKYIFRYTFFYKYKNKIKSIISA